MALSPGTALGTYHIIGPLGAGGMGEVYRARDTTLNRDVAIKVLPDLVAQDRDRLARFEREAQLLASLNHPNIASIYGMHESDGVKAIVMELVEGETLDARPIPIDEAIEVARQIAVGLEAAHDKGIIHRDLKPANVKRTPDGTVKILDFGLAKALADDTAAASDLSHSPTVTALGTRDGMILGTAAYMSPEQARGLTLDERTDIWAFGCILYGLLANRSAFGGATASDVLVSVLSREPDWSALPAATPAAMRRLLRRCLEKDRRRRLHAIADARIEIDDARTDDFAAPPRTASRARSTWLGWAVAAIAAAAAIVLAVRSSGPRPGAAPSLMDATPQPLTFDPGLTMTPAISRDARLVAYASDRARRSDLDIWVQQIAGGTPLRLTDDPADEQAPDFSPDGSQIVFRSERDRGGVYIVSTLGGEPRLIASEGQRPRFSPDGSRIAYWTGERRGGTIAASATYVVPLAGGTASRLLPDFAIAHDPIWSPDNRTVLVSAMRIRGAANDEVDWWLAPVDGTAPVRTEAARLPAVKASLASSPAGYQWRDRDVLFSDGSSMWFVPMPSSGRVVGPATRITLGVEQLRDPSATADNTIVFSSQIVTRVIERAPLGDAERPAPAARLHTDNDNRGVDGRASQTQDGSLLAMTRDREIWTKDVRTGKERLVVRVEGRISINATLSQDGARIAYNADRVGYVVETSGGVPRRVCDPCEPHGFLSDGRRILLSPMQFAAGPLALLDLATGTTQDLIAAAPDIALVRPHASSDDRWLAFRREIGGRGKTFVVPLTPGKPPAPDTWAQVDEPTASGRPAGWSMDSRILYLLLDTDGFRCLWGQRVDAAGRLVGTPYAARHFHGTNESNFSTSFGNAITADGFLYEGTRRSGNIWMLTPRRSRP